MITLLFSVIITAVIFWFAGFRSGWILGNRHYGRKIRERLNAKHRSFKNAKYSEFIDGFQDGLLFAEDVVNEQKGL